jgi:quercetin dioxygenase-like cupin family protein
MRAFHYTQVEAEEVKEGARGATVRWLISARQGAPNFAMRVFEIAPGGSAPRHQHAWEHEVFVLAGQGELRGGEAALPLREGCAAYVAPGELHQFAAGPGGMMMICCVPNPK